MKNIIESLNWRYATKKFDFSKKIDETTLGVLLEALRLSPSSYGLQPWKFIVINNTDIREKIKLAGYGQPQITEASHLIVLANKKNINNNLIDDYIKFISEYKGVDISKMEGLSQMIKGALSGKSELDKRAWAAHQLYLAAGVLVSSCAFLEIDTCPIEGFDTLKVDEILNLPSLDLESKVIIAIGYRSTEDKHSQDKKIRFPKEEVVIEIN